MRLEYDPIQTANVAPYLELMQKQQQQPMIDALNRQKLQEGMLNMGSLEYAQRKKMEEDAQSRDAALIIQQSMQPYYSKDGIDVPANTEGATQELRLQQAETFKAMLEKGINPKVAAEAMAYAGTGTGATSADKQANAIELLNQKLQSAKELADEKASGQEAKLNLNQYDKLIESTAGLVGEDFWSNKSRDTAKAELAAAIASAGKDPDKIAQIFDAFRSSTTSDWGMLSSLNNAELDSGKFKSKLADILSVPKQSKK